MCQVVLCTFQHIIFSWDPIPATLRSMTHDQVPQCQHFNTGGAVSHIKIPLQFYRIDPLFTADQDSPPTVHPFMRSFVMSIRRRDLQRLCLSPASYRVAPFLTRLSLCWVAKSASISSKTRRSICGLSLLATDQFVGPQPVRRLLLPAQLSSCLSGLLR